MEYYLMSKTLYFKTHTLLKNLIGKDLINDDNIGVIELVKNSHDASASHVDLIFDNFPETLHSDDTSRLLIVDNGIGMSEKDIKDKWLNVAYSDKKDVKNTTGSYFAGNKGVGRFSCDRLGVILNMITREKDGKILHLEVDWSDFEAEGDKNLTLQQVGVKLSEISEEGAEKISGVKHPSSGTVLVISKLRSIWGYDEILRLKRDLEKFINPNQEFIKSGFNINLSASCFKDEKKDYKDRVNGEVRNLVFDTLKFKTTYIESQISIDGNEIESNLYHDGEKVFRIVERNNYFPKLKNIKITLYYLNPYKKSYFKKQTGIRSIDFGSVFLFLNGFRVAPYGERGNDWLGLDIRKAQGQTRFFGNRDIIGRIEVFDSEDNFKPVSSREGLKNTPEFSLLRENYFFDVFKRLERFVVNGLDWDSVPENARKEISSSDSLDWDNTTETYIESWDKKKRRISVAIMTLINTSKDRVISLWFNTELMDGLVEQKSNEVLSIIKKIDSFDGDVLDDDLKNNLNKISDVLRQKDEEVKNIKQEVSNLKVEVDESKQEISHLKSTVVESQEVIIELKKKEDESLGIIADLEVKTEQFQSQTLFLKSISTLDTKTLLGYHHQICLDSSTIDNYIGRAVKALRNEKDITKALNFIEKIAKANKKITATAQYATKANFKSGSRKELTDLPTYFEQYIDNVTRDFSGSSISINVNNDVNESFEIKVKRIELSILIDNIVSNATKANASSINVTMKKVSDNLLQISFIDDGNGISKDIDIDSVFDLGVTTTQGSGLGLYHSKQVMNSLSSEISLLPNNTKGAEIRMVFSR